MTSSEQINSSNPSSELPDENERPPSDKVKKPSFPPTIKPCELIEKALKSFREGGKLINPPNAFFAYKMGLKKECNVEGTCMRSFSKTAGKLWRGEPQYVKDRYRKIASDAQALYAEKIRTPVNDDSLTASLVDVPRFDFLLTEQTEPEDRTDMNFRLYDDLQNTSYVTSPFHQSTPLESGRTTPSGTFEPNISANSYDIPPTFPQANLSETLEALLSPNFSQINTSSYDPSPILSPNTDTSTYPLGTTKAQQTINTPTDIFFRTAAHQSLVCSTSASLEERVGKIEESIRKTEESMKKMEESMRKTEESTRKVEELLVTLVKNGTPLGGN